MLVCIICITYIIMLINVGVYYMYYMYMLMLVCIICITCYIYSRVGRSIADIYIRPEVNVPPRSYIEAMDLPTIVYRIYATTSQYLSSYGCAITMVYIYIYMLMLLCIIFLLAMGSCIFWLEVILHVYSVSVCL